LAILEGKALARLLVFTEDGAVCVDVTDLKSACNLASLGRTERMELRTYVSFEWNEADDGEFDCDGSVIAPGGQQILEQIGDGLRERGFQVTDIDMHETYGWSFEVIAGRVPVWCMIQYAEPWLLVTNVPLQLLYWLRGRRPATQHSCVCAAVHDTLASCGRARAIRWFGRREYERGRGRGGADKP